MNNKAKKTKAVRKTTAHNGKKKKDILEIIKEQGVKPFDFSKAGENWPKDADFDEFLEAIHSGRK